MVQKLGRKIIAEAVQNKAQDIYIIPKKEYENRE